MLPDGFMRLKVVIEAVFRTQILYTSLSATNLCFTVGLVFEIFTFAFIVSYFYLFVNRRFHTTNIYVFLFNSICYSYKQTVKQYGGGDAEYKRKRR